MLALSVMKRLLKILRPEPAGGKTEGLVAPLGAEREP
jgi:hypothetical protein